MCSGGCGTGALTGAGRRGERTRPLWKAGWHFLKKLEILYPCGSAILLLGCPRQEMKTRACTPRLVHKYPPMTNKYTNQLSNDKKVLGPNTRGMNLKNVLSDGSQMLKTTGRVTSSICHFQKRKIGRDREQDSDCLGLAVGTHMSCFN